MKLEILVLVTGIIGLEAAGCYPFIDGLICKRFTLQTDVPLRLSTPHYKITLEEAKGAMNSVTFEKLQNIVKLKFDSSKIEYMQDGTLCSLKKLRVLKIEYNGMFPKLTHKSMGECDNLQEFEYTKSLHSNNEFLENFDTDVFKSMKNVRSIDLYNFVFKKFDKAVLEGLESLENFTIFSGVMDEIEDDAFCTPNLKDIFLDLNTDIFSGRLFKTCKNVTTLYIDSNLKNVFKEDTLQSMTQLKKVSLKVNLVSVSKNLFANLFKLEYIRLSGCHINYIEEDAFKDQTNLNELILHTNFFNHFNGNFFKPLKNLEILHLGSTGIKGIENIKHLPNLKFLDISMNEIRDFNTTMLKNNLPGLKKLRIYDFIGTCKRGKEIQKELENVVIIEDMFPYDDSCLKQ